MRIMNEIRIEDLPETTNFEPIPEGWYTARIVRAELKDTKDGTGQYIALRYDITGPSYQGRVVFSNINIVNASPTAESIGRRQLRELMGAIGLSKLSDTDQLIGAHLQIKVGVRPGNDEYPPQNDVRGVKSIGGGNGQMFNAGASNVSSPAQPQVSAAPDNKPAPPWARR